MISEDEVMLGDWHFDAFEDVVDYSAIPEQLLLVQVVDEKGLMLLHVAPGHQVRKAVGVEADECIDLWPFLGRVKGTDQCCSRYCHISMISISLHYNLLNISFIGFD